MSFPPPLRRADLVPIPLDGAARSCVILITADDLSTARCPLCRHPLIARQGRHRPYWHCGCARRERQASGE